MLRTVSDAPTLWESVIPECLMGLPGDLAQIDELLDDPRFFEPFRAFFDPVMGRPSIPMETYVRMMFLKYRYRLGFEPLCTEVADSLAWRRFCRIPLGCRVPHPTTLMKITSRCGPRAIDELNDALLATAHENKLVRLNKLRADTTVVEANVAYPTDSDCWPRVSPSWPGSPGRSTPQGWRRAPRPGTGPVRCAAGCTTSGRGCGAAATRPRPKCWPSTARWPASPSTPWPMPVVSPATLAGACATARWRQARPWRCWPSSSAPPPWWSGSRRRPGCD